MTTIRRFKCEDLFHFNGVNFDYFTETVRLSYKRRGMYEQPAEAIRGPASSNTLHRSSTCPSTSSTWQNGLSTASLPKGPAVR